MDKHYADTVRLLLAISPDVFANDIFALKGGTAINLFVQDMPRLSVDLDVVYRPWQVPREQALRAINKERKTVSVQRELRDNRLVESGFPRRAEKHDVESHWASWPANIHTTTEDTRNAAHTERSAIGVPR
jgi:predicted nucleotidyltransferase component of viral defense system